MKPDFLTHSTRAWTNLWLLAVSMLLALSARAQYSYVSTQATDCTMCDAQIDFLFDEVVDFELSFYYNGSPVPDLVIIDSGDEVSIPDMCPGNYNVTISINGEEESIPLSLASNDESAGEGGIAYICSTAISVPLSNFLDGSQTGGNWSDPLNQPHSGNFDPVNDVPGVYTYTSNGFCGYYSEVWVNVNVPADPGNATTYLICENYPTFQMFDVLFGDPEPGGNWYAVGNVPIEGDYEPGVDVPGIFIYEIDTVQGCPAVYNTLFIIENQIPDPGIDGALSVCPDATPFDMTTYLGGTPQGGGQWENSANQDVDAIFDPLVDPPGTYEYTIIGATPCPSLSAELSISFNDGIDAGENAVVQVCENSGAVDLFAALGGEPDPGGTWTDPLGNPTTELQNAATAIPGTYMYLLQATGCPDESSEVELIIDSTVSAGMSMDLTECNSVPFFDLDLLLGDVYTAGGTWFDENNIEVPSMLSLSDGVSYTFNYIVEGGACPDDESTHIIEILETPYAGEDQDLEFCVLDGVINLEDLVSLDPQLPELWLNIDEQPVSSNYNLASGNTSFYYIVESINSCPGDTALISLNVVQPDAENGSEALTVCSTDALIVLNTYLPEDFNSGGVWEYEGSTVEPGVVDPDELNDGLYSYSAPTSGICPAPVFELNLTINPVPDAGSGGVIQRCLNANPIVLSELPDIDADEGGYWTYEGQLLEGSSFSPQESGNLNYVVEGLEPCPNSQAVWELDVLPLPQFEAGSDVLTCSDVGSVQVGAAPNPGYTYSWSPTTGLSDSESSSPQLIVEEVNGLTELEYVVLVSDGVCESSDTLSVELYPLPEIGEPNFVALCEGESFDIGIPVNWTYSLTPDEWLLTEEEGSLELLPEESGIVLIELTNQYACSSDHEIEVEVNPLPVLNFSIDPEQGCPPLEVRLTNESPDQGDVNYHWLFNSENLFQDTVLVLYESGIYDIGLIGVSAFGCEAQLQMPGAVEVYPDPIAQFEFTPENPNAFTEELTIVNTSLSISTSNWYLNDQYVTSMWQPEFGIPIIEDLYQEVCLELTNGYGCMDTLCRPIVVQGDYTFYVPNAFTPNNDGRNEVFIPVIRGATVDHYTFRIWNRWGEMIFETNDLDQGWLGNVDQGEYYVPPGVYVWQVLLRNKYTGNDIEETGSVTVIR